MAQLAKWKVTLTPWHQLNIPSEPRLSRTYCNMQDLRVEAVIQSKQISLPSVKQRRSQVVSSTASKFRGDWSPDAFYPFIIYANSPCLDAFIIYYLEGMAICRPSHYPFGLFPTTDGCRIYPKDASLCFLPFCDCRKILFSPPWKFRNHSDASPHCAHFMTKMQSQCDAFLLYCLGRVLN